MRHAALALSLSLGLPVVGATQTLEVKIIQRQNGTTEYGYVVPSISRTQATANCRSGFVGNSVNCSGTSTEIGLPAREYSYQVRGATYTLLLPDGRRVVVNCVSKYAPRGDSINQRDCRMPLVDEIKVDFDDDDAKLIWPVSLDGKKTQSETYKILAILKSEE